MSSIQQFARRIPNFGSLIQQPGRLAPFLAYFLEEEEGATSVSGGALGSLYDELRVRPPANLPDTLRRSRAFVRAKKGGYRLSHQGREMVINAMGTDPDEAKITREDHPRIESAPDADPSEQPKRSNFSTRNVLVVYGRDELLRRDLFVFLRTVGLNPLEFEEIVQQTGTASPYVLDALKLAFTNVQACVVLFSPDETVQLRPHLRSSHDPEGAELQPRPNVLVEAGMAMALQPARTILVRVGKVRSFSDFDGKHYVNLTGTAESRNKLVGKLRVAGCDPRTADDDWLTVGNFKPSGEDQI